VPTARSVTGTKQGSRRGTCGWITSFLRDFLERTVYRTIPSIQINYLALSQICRHGRDPRFDHVNTISSGLASALTGYRHGNMSTRQYPTVYLQRSLNLRKANLKRFAFFAFLIHCNICRHTAKCTSEEV